MVYDNAEAEEFANQIFMLHTSQEPPTSYAENNHAPQGSYMKPNHVHFRELFYVADEND